MRNLTGFEVHKQTKPSLTGQNQEITLDILQVLLRSCSDPSTRKQLISSYDVLMNPAKMGERFHFFGLLHPSRLAKPKRSEGLKLETKRSPAQLPVGGFTELRFS